MVSNDYKKVFNYLLEYEIKNGVDNTPIGDDEIELIPTLSEEDPTPTSDESEGNTTEPIVDVKQEGEPQEDDKLDIVGELVKIQKQNIDSIFSYLEDVKNEIENINFKVNDIDQLKVDNINLYKKVKDLTPPTPLESLNKMVKLSGGVSLDDYWKEFSEKNGLEKTGALPYYQNGVEKKNDPMDFKNEIPKPNKNYNDREIKDSFNR